MINPLDVHALRARNIEARRRYGHIRRRSGQLAATGALISWMFARVDTFTPIRVLNLFLFRYGTVMAAGAAYMMFFSATAAIAVGFSVAGIVIGNNRELQATIVTWVDTVTHHTG